MLCVFSEDEAAKLSSVVMSAEVIKAASLPLQLSHTNHSVADKPAVFSHRSIKKHKKKTVDSSVCNARLCDLVDDVSSRCIAVNHQGSSKKSNKKKHKRLSQVNATGSVELNNRVKRCKVNDADCTNVYRKQKHKRTSDITNVSCSTNK